MILLQMYYLSVLFFLSFVFKLVIVSILRYRLKAFNFSAVFLTSALMNFEHEVTVGNLEDFYLRQNMLIQAETLCKSLL